MEHAQNYRSDAPNEEHPSVSQDGDVERSNEESGETNGESAQSDQSKAIPDAEEPVSYTLEEYKAMKLSSKPKVTLQTSGARKPNDGKDVFKNMIAHRKFNENAVDEVEVIEEERKVSRHPFPLTTQLLG